MTEDAFVFPFLIFFFFLQSSWHPAPTSSFIFVSPDGLVCPSCPKPAVMNLACKEFSFHSSPIQCKTDAQSNQQPKQSKAHLLTSLEMKHFPPGRDPYFEILAKSI